MKDYVKEFRSMMRAAVAALACAWIAYGGILVIQMRVEREDIAERVEAAKPEIMAEVVDTKPHPCREGYTLYLVEERTSEHDIAPMTHTYMLISSGQLAEYHKRVLDPCGYSIPVQEQ